MIELRVLGEIRLLSATGVELDGLLRQPKRLALLAYVASPCPGTWHRRDMLLALFWPELDTAHARTSLRNGIYVLRQTLGDDVVRNRGDEEISVNPNLLRSDLAAVWKALNNSQPDEALAHYRGELLPGLFPSDCDGFQRWLESERARLKVAVTTVAMGRISELEKDNRHAEALAIARKVIDMQPDDETVVRRVMTLHDAMGDRAGALGVFESYRSRLASDYDAEPAPETLAFASRLRELTRVTASRRRPSAASAEIQPSTPDGSTEHLPGLIIDTDRVRAGSRIVAISLLVLGVVAIVGGLAWRLTRQEQPLAIGNSRPLTVDEGLQIEVALSPNGRLVAYAKGNINRLRIYVQKIGGGAAWPLTDDSSANVFEMVPRWSPDNDEVLFLSHNNAYISPSLGGIPRLVARGSEVDGMVRSASWSPTGDSIAIVRRDSLLVQPLHGAGTRFIGYMNQLHSCVWSPDNKWIACVTGNWLAYAPGPLFGNDAPSGIVMYPARGGRPVALTGNAFENASPAWSADGKFLWMLSNRDGVSGEVYAVPIGDDGRASGSFVRAGLKAESVGLSAGRIVYSVPSRKANIWAIPIPVDTAVTLSSARKITSGNQVIEITNASRDGKWLVYDSNLSGDANIYRIPVDGGIAERLTDDPRPEYAGDISPDGNELVWQRWMNGQRHLFVKRLDGGPEQDVIPGAGDQGVAQWSPNGSSIVAWSHNLEQGAVFVVSRDASGKWRRPSWRLDDAMLPVWSPDGRTIAYRRFDGRVESISADSGARYRIYTPRPKSDDPKAESLQWSADPQTIWMLAGDTAGRGGIWALPVNGATPRLRVDLTDALGRSFGPKMTANRSTFFITLEERTANVRWAELIRR